MWVKTAHRLLQQEARRGELSIILLAIALAVMAVYSLSGFASRVQQALESRSSAFLAADRVVRSAYPIDPALYQDLLDPDTVRTAHLLEFQTMVYAGDEFLLTSVKAIEGPYPLRGELRVRVAGADQDGLWQGPPAPGTVWLQERLLQALGVSIGDSVEVGRSRLVVAGVLVAEPDTSFNVFRAGPRLMMNRADVEAAGVVLPGSRLTYLDLFAGEETALERLGRGLAPRLAPNQEWYGIRDGSSPLAGALQRAEKFLLLASLLGVILAATAIAVAARRYTERHYDPVAVFKTLGFPRRAIRNLYAWQLLIITSLGTLLGLAVGQGLQWIALELVADRLPAELPAASWKPLWMAVLTGVLCATLFSFTPMLRLLGVPPMRVIRRDLEMPARLQWLAMLLAGLALLTLIVLFSRDLTLSLSLFGSAAAIGVVLMGVSRLMILLGRRASREQGGAVGLALAGLYRRAGSNAVQVMSFALALMLLVTIVVLRSDLIDDWQQQLPEGTPNHFLVNVSEAELDPLTQLLEGSGIRRSELFPMVRGRLVAINGEPVQDQIGQTGRGEEERGRPGVGRELNLTWRQDLPPANTLVSGQWWSDASGAEVSVETEIAGRLGIGLGDEVTFLMGGETRSATVTSLREVDWNSMQPNFYMIFSPGALAGFPASYIGAFHLQPQQKPLLNELLRQHPTVTILELDTIIRQIQGVIQQVSVALQYIMLLVVAASVLVLFAQTQASFEERRQEMVILRTLGASGRFIRRTIQNEFVALGLFAGVLAGMAAELTLFLVQTLVLEMPWQFHGGLWLIAGLAGGLFVGGVGRLACRPLLTQNALKQIRQLG